MPDSDTLLQRYLEGSLTPEQAAQLQSELEATPQLGQQLLRHLEIDAMLRSTKPLAATKPHLRSPAAPSRRFTLTTLTAVAAVAACLTLGSTWLLLSGPADSAKETTTASVAVLTRGVNVDWETASISPGTPLSPGWLKWKSGIAQIEFYQGARVVIEGPAELQLISSGEAICNRGRLSAHVPPQAKGFRIQTPKGTIVDLGTDFALDLSESNAEVHVFKGEVELHPGTQAMRSLKQGQAMAFSSTQPQLLAANASSFSSLSDIDSRTAQSDRSQFQHWLSTRQQLTADPSLRLYFDFQDTNHTLRNHAAAGEDGSIVGASWTTGRWQSKGALEFRNVSDRVRLSAPAEVKCLTMAVWVRIHGLDRSFNSLFMSESWRDRKIHWQIVREGKIRLGVAGSPEKSFADYDTEVYFTPERFGRWTHLAVSFDPQSKQVRHYANGALLATVPMRDSSPLKPGIAELGNWNDRRAAGSGVAIRHLSGAMDEFMLWDRVLSDEEIKRLAE